MFESALEKTVFLYFSILMCIAGTMYMFKNYEPKDSHGKWLGSFWLFLGIVFLTVFIRFII